MSTPARPVAPQEWKARGSASNQGFTSSTYHDLRELNFNEPLIDIDEVGITTSKNHSLPSAPRTSNNSKIPQRLLDDSEDWPWREDLYFTGDEGDFVLDSTTTKEPLPQHDISGQDTYPSYLCGQCDEQRSTSFYCNLCDMTYCEACWPKVGPHRTGRLGPGGIPHEKTDQEVADKLRATFEAFPTDVEQEALFDNDQNTAWFGVLKDDSGDLIFHDYGRYPDIMTEIAKANRSPKGTSNRFPGLVCFVGETGAGKSTLIKVLIELSEAGAGHRHQTPVVGSIRHQDVPTSGDVHLYTDPKTYLSDSPILYADCEGLAGGEREPKGARSKVFKKMGVGPYDHTKRTKSFEKNRRNLRHSTEREITWATTSEKQTREFAVTQLYPRLLYTFSDVVVFVLKNPRVIENVIEKLVEWASAALEMSSNQPVLPHAVIALNASELGIDPDQWSVDHATRWLMNSVRGGVVNNPKFKKHAHTWRARGKQIDTVEDLLLSYYSSIRVVRIPGVGRPKLIKDQMEKLYDEISLDVESSRKSKRNLRMLLDADELQPYLHSAFDHFSSNLDRAFDFVQASFLYNPIPSDFAGNILKLAVNVMEVWKHKLGGAGIFRELSFMVASCIMLDSARNKTRGAAELIFPEYVEHCDNALEDFCDRYWPCEYVMKLKAKGGKEVGGRCVNVRSGHGSKGHQLQNGKVFKVGSYESKFSVETHQEQFRNDVYGYLKELLKELRETISESQSEEEVAAQIHQKRVMTLFYQHVAQGNSEIIVSHSTCFSCLMRSPEHALPCGHVLCTSCLRAYGQPSLDKYTIEIYNCPLHINETNFRWKIFLKPEAAGVRVLTLDGGGIRGIVELEILRAIEHVWGGHMRIQDFLDLIVGTSTGGLIALGLVSKGWTVEECRIHFEKLCKKAFTRRYGINMSAMSLFVESFHGSKYETAPLQQALQRAYSEEAYLFGGPQITNIRTKVAVTATTAGNVSVLANYNRHCGEKLSYTFQRPEKLENELKLWEAARATSAAPRIFKPFCHEASKHVYIDGGVYHNNPIQVADIERKLLWPTEGINVPDFVLSIGTAYNPNSRRKMIEKSSMSTIGIFSYAKSLTNIAMDHLRSSLDSEKTWTDHVQQLNLPEHHKSRYQRINPVLLEDLPALDDVDNMKKLQETIRVSMKDDAGIARAAHRLVATSFYFEKITDIDLLPSGKFVYKGVIRCRVPKSTLREFGYFLSRSYELSNGPYFIIRERNKPSEAEQVLIPQETLLDLTNKDQWRMDPITIIASSMISLTEIVFCLRRHEEFAISGFPRSFQEQNGKHLAHQSSTSNVGRWRNRTGSQQRQRKKWTQPSERDRFNTSHDPRRTISLASYSNETYIVGDSTDAELLVVREQLGHDLAPLPAELSAVDGLIYEMGDTSIRAELNGDSLQKEESSDLGHSYQDSGRGFVF